MLDSEKHFMRDLESLEADSRLLDGLVDAPAFNLFRELKIERLETRHSNALAWLMDGSKSHGFGAKFLKAMLSPFGCHLKGKEKATFLADAKVERETNHIDLLIFSKKQKIVIVIENKIRAKEREKQLRDYLTIVENKFGRYSKYYVFLTPEGRQSNDEPMCQIWHPCSYSDVYQLLKSLHNRFYVQRCKRNDEEVVIRNYLDVLKKEVLKMPDKEEREKLLNFYQEHKTALDRLYEVIHPGVVGEIWNALRSIAKKSEFRNKGFLLPAERLQTKSPTFCVKAIDDYLGNIKSNNGSWGDKRAYACEIKIDYDNERLCCNFILGGVNCSEEQVYRMKSISDFPEGFKSGMSAEKAKELAQRSKRGIQFHFCKWNGSSKYWQDYSEQGVEEAVEKVVAKFLDWANAEQQKWEKARKAKKPIPS